LKRKKYFCSENDPLSNFFMVNLRVWDRVFKSLEHAYQWRKAIYLGQESVAWRIMNTGTASQAKRIADNELDTKGTDWNRLKDDIMYELLTIKFQQYNACRDALLQSGDDELVEDTNHEYWARGYTGHGLNMLGKLMMYIRDTLNGASTENYRAPANGVASPCFQCGEGNHNQQSCRHQGALQCRQCLSIGHKVKHCPDSH
jgi:ribA/ribD-fused uncharacterized protein